MKFVFSFFLALCLSTGAYAQCSVQQGLELGCQLAYEANANGCNSLRCAVEVTAAYAENIVECPEYANAIRDGFRSCNGSTPPGSGAGSGPSSPTGPIPGGGRPPKPSRDCIWTGFYWACE